MLTSYRSYLKMAGLGLYHGIEYELTNNMFFSVGSIKTNKFEWMFDDNRISFRPQFGQFFFFFFLSFQL